MIHGTEFEYLVFLIMLGLGVCGGVLYEFLQFIWLTLKHNKFIKNILDFLFCIIFMLMFFFGLNQFNFGAFRLYLFLSYILGFYFERKTIGKLIAKILLFVYNKSIKILKFLKTSKVGLFLFK